MTDGKNLGSLYDLSDETESYNVERKLLTGREYFENPSQWIWKNEDVKKFGKTINPPAYQNLPSGPININSKEGKDLRKKTFEAGKNGTAIQEVYKGWQKDYNKGLKKRK